MIESWSGADWEVFFRTFIALLVIIDPADNLVVFHVLTERFTARQRAATLLVAVLASAVLLGSFVLGGAGLLAWLGVSPASFRVAAGLLLLPMVYSLVVEGELPQTRGNIQLDPLQVELVPLAMPLLAGPGALASVVAYAGGNGQGTTLAAVALVLLITAIGFALASTVFRLAGGAVMRLVARIIGLAVFAIATEFVLSGLTATLRNIR